MVKKITIKKSAMFYASILVFLLCAATTCKKDKDCPIGSHASISLVNNSSRTLNWRHFTPDSIYRINGSTPASDMIIQPNSSDKYGTRDCWEETFKDGYSAYFLIFNNDTVQAIGWQTISGSNRGLLKRVKVDLIYLQNNNFTITYP
jgi:hypothetical protein